MTLDLKAATALTPLEAPREGSSPDRATYAVGLDPQWTIGPKMHGGYLMAVLARAATEVAGEQHPHVTALGCSFIAAPAPGEGVVEVEVLRRGRSATQLRAQLVQGDQLCVEAVLTLGLLTDDDPWWTDLAPVDVPAEDDCFLLPSSTGEMPLALMEAVHLRVDPERLGWAVGEPSGQGRIAGWQRLANGDDWDPTSLLVALDASPPVSFDLGSSGWAPTIQFSAYLRRLPAPGPIRFSVQAHDLGGERMDETAYAWDSRGRLVGQATQIAGVRRPR